MSSTSPEPTPTPSEIASRHRLKGRALTIYNAAAATGILRYDRAKLGDGVSCALFSTWSDHCRVYQIPRVIIRDTAKKSYIVADLIDDYTLDPEGQKLIHELLTHHQAGNERHGPTDGWVRQADADLVAKQIRDIILDHSTPPICNS